MSIVTLASGGLDSSLIAVMAKVEGIHQFPLFIDYGQRSVEAEYQACLHVHKEHDLPVPQRMSMSGFGGLISSGLTDTTKDVFQDAFLPGRNMLLLLSGYAYAYQNNASAVSIGLLTEENHIFPDQTQVFLKEAENMLTVATGHRIEILAPLITYRKTDVIELADEYNITNTYSCHMGNEEPCGKCISCLEFLNSIDQGE